MKKLLLSILLILIIFPHNSIFAEVEKVPITVLNLSTNLIGDKVIDRYMGMLKRCDDITLIEPSQKVLPIMFVVISTTDSTLNDITLNSAISYSITWMCYLNAYQPAPYCLNNGCDSGLCTDSSIDQTAERMMVRTDEAIKEFYSMRKTSALIQQ